MCYCPVPVDVSSSVTTALTLSVICARFVPVPVSRSCCIVHSPRCILEFPPVKITVSFEDESFFTFSLPLGSFCSHSIMSEKVQIVPVLQHLQVQLCQQSTVVTTVRLYKAQYPLRTGTWRTFTCAVVILPAVLSAHAQ